MERNWPDIWEIGLIVLLLTTSVNSHARPIFDQADTLLVLNDSLAGSSLGKVTGGQFLSPSGWKVSDPGAMIFYDLNTYISNGSLEITVTNFDPRSENTFKRHHVISMYTNKWGEHHQIEFLDTDWNFHTGFNYREGIKLQSATYGDNKQVVLPADSLKWDENQIYRLKFVWNGDTVRFYRNDTLLICTSHLHRFLLRYIFLGRDRTISGDYVTNYHFQQYPAMVGPIFSNLVVKKIIADSLSEVPRLLSFSCTNTYANAARLKWELSIPGISRLEFRTSEMDPWDRTYLIGPPERNYEICLDNLQPDKGYEARVVIKDEAGNEYPSAPISFQTRSGGIYLFKPQKDTFVENSDVLGPARNLANMGWLYLMVGQSRELFLQFPTIEKSLTPRLARLRLHTRNTDGHLSNICVWKLDTPWSEDSTTWENKPSLPDSCLLKGTGGIFLPDKWAEYNLNVTKPLSHGLNIAITSPDSGWVSFDSKESLAGQPELILDFRSNYNLKGLVATPRGTPIPWVNVRFFCLDDSSYLSLRDTIETDKSGTFSIPLEFGNTYKIKFNRPVYSDDWNAISIYDAYLAARLAVGIDSETEFTKIAADANADGFVTIYDALLIAKKALGMDVATLPRHWTFLESPVLTNMDSDSISINSFGVLVGDVDFNWSWLNPEKPAFQKIEPAGQFSVEYGDSSVIVHPKWPGYVNMGAFSIDLSYSADVLKLRQISWPERMKKWRFVNNSREGRIRIGGFASVKSNVSINNFRLIFSRIRSNENFKIVINKIQLDKWERSDILVDRAGLNENIGFRIFPNPFNMATRIEWDLNEQGPVQLIIYNAIGQAVYTKVLPYSMGRRSFVWRGEDDHNEPMSSGLYFCVLKIKTSIFRQKILLLK